MKVYIRKRKDGEPDYYDDWLLTAYWGFRALEADITFIESTYRLPFNPSDVVVTTIEDTVSFLEKHDIRIPKPLGIPESLMDASLLQRKVEIKTLGEFKQETNLPVFVKPYTKVKEFFSGVINYSWSRENLFHDIPEDTMVMTSEIIEIKSEYRCFVHHGQLVGMKHYSGDFQIFPSMNMIQYAIKQFHDAPAAYTIDFGIIRLENGNLLTVLIECNDAWSIGSYGLEPIIYAKMIRDRWFQMIKNKI